MSQSTAFSTPETRIFEQPTEEEEPDGEEEIREGDIGEYYQVDEVVRVIRSRGAKSVAVQLPDSLLGDLMELSARLEAAVADDDVLVFFLGDTSYGACCVDEVAAEHLDADLVVHFGRSCLSRPSRLPALLVFGRVRLDASHFALEVRALHAGTIVLSYDTDVASQRAALRAALRAEGVAEVVEAPLDLDGAADGAPVLLEPVGDGEGVDGGGGAARVSGRRLDDVLALLAAREGDDGRDGVAWVHVGRASRCFRNLHMRFSGLPFHLYHVGRGGAALRPSEARISAALQRRYYLVQKAKDAESIGIVMGTLSVSRYMHVLERVRDAIERAGKRSYTVVIGKVNEAKLANFDYIDLFVLVACPENALIDCRGFVQPIITVFELDLAMRDEENSWTTEYSTELPGDAALSAAAAAASATGTGGAPRFSLIDGSYHRALRNDDDSDEDDDGVDSGGGSREMIRHGGRGGDLTKWSPAAAQLLKREWKGLDPRIGQTEVTGIHKGLSGIAISYEDEDGKEK